MSGDAIDVAYSSKWIDLFVRVEIIVDFTQLLVI